MPIDFNFMVAGEAGQGIQSVGFLLAKVFARGGYHVFADQDYDSRIRGGHNFFRVRVQDGPVGAIAESLDILLAFNKESIDWHHPELVTGGVVIYDGEKITGVSGNGSFFGVPLERLAQEKTGDKLMANTVALGAALALVDYDQNILNTVLTEHFGKGKVADGNISAARAGYEYTQAEYKGDLRQRLKPLSDARRMLLTGNEAMSLGAIAAGCKFMAAYPMTPTTSIMEYFAAKAKDYGLVM
ncbi:MAG: 2-oxoacid:acceptor oxidoreductase family protein, partial [Chloroflexi bacterium]|nr:2-oxoacid:acceptor oxidoreductase family protein [Chloroflexota bacterium]